MIFKDEISISPLDFGKPVYHHDLDRIDDKPVGPLRSNYWLKLSRLDWLTRTHTHTRTHVHTHARTHARMHARIHTHTRMQVTNACTYSHYQIVISSPFAISESDPSSDDEGEETVTGAPSRADSHRVRQGHLYITPCSGQSLSHRSSRQMAVSREWSFSPIYSTSN